MDGLLTIQEAAPALRISPMTLRRLIRNNQIGFRKVGRRFLFKKEDIDQYLDRNYQEPKKAVL